MRLLCFGMMLVACGPQPSFDEKKCPFTLDASQIQGQTVRCGTLNTPETHAKPDKLIKVPVVIFLGKKSGYAPVVNLAGGPGQSWEDLGLNFFKASDTVKFNEDVVFIEQRGTGLSTPRLDCGDQGSLDNVAYIQGCANTLTKSGVAVQAYNTLELAGDVDTFAKVIGYKKITLNGVSYGTAWGLEVMRHYPSILAGAVLDSVLSPASPPFGNGGSLADGSFTAFFQTCADNADCAANFGDLQTKMLNAMSSLDSLDKSGHSLPISDGTKNADGTYKVAGSIGQDAFYETCHTLLATDAADLPLWISDVSQALQAGVLVIPGSVSDSNSAEAQATQSDAFGQYMSVMCSYDQRVTLPEATADTKKVRKQFQPYLDSSFWVALCQYWPYQKFGDDEFTPVSTNAPALLLSGDIDPLTPPEWAAEVATALPVSTLVQVPGVGHDVSASNSQSVQECVSPLISGFYHGTAKEDPSCAAQVTVAFTGPDQTAAREVDFHHIFHIAHSHDLRDKAPKYDRAFLLQRLSKHW